MPIIAGVAISLDTPAGGIPAATRNTGTTLTKRRERERENEQRQNTGGKWSALRVGEWKEGTGCSGRVASRYLYYPGALDAYGWSTLLVYVKTFMRIARRPSVQQMTSESWGVSIKACSELTCRPGVSGGLCRGRS